MSIKHFCDCCDKEFQPQPGIALVAPIKLSNGKTAGIEIRLKGGTAADLCRYCLIDAVQSLDDRPRGGLNAPT